MALERPRSLRYRASSGEETVDLGRKMGMTLRPGDVVGLIGELGCGKTWFTKGLAVGLEVPSETVVTSPSFILVNEYEGRCPLFHMDAYRLKGITDFVSAGLEEFLYREGVAIIEWADRVLEILPDWRTEVRFNITGDQDREITVSGFEPRALKILDEM